MLIFIHRASGATRLPPPGSVPHRPGWKNPVPKPNPAGTRQPSVSSTYPPDTDLDPESSEPPRRSPFPEAARDYSTELSVTVAVGASLLFLNVLAFAALYYKRDKRHEMMLLQQRRRHRRLSPQRGTAGAPIPSTAIAVGNDLEEELMSLRMKQQRAELDLEPLRCPPDYTLALRRAPDDVPLMMPSTISAMHAFNTYPPAPGHTPNPGPAPGSSSSSVHTNNALPHQHSTTRV